MRTWQAEGGCTVTQMMSGRSNAFVVSRGTRALLFDTGRRKRRGTLFARLDAMGLPRIDALVVSHAHFDHTENAAAVRERYRARVIVHGSEAALLRSGHNAPAVGTIPPARLVALLLKRLQTRFGYEPCESDIQVDDRFELDSFGLDARLLHTPGHTPGSLTLVAGDELALVGDTLFGVLPGGTFPPFAEDVSRLIQSWGALLQTPCRLFLPGHGRAIPRETLESGYRHRRV